MDDPHGSHAGEAAKSVVVVEREEDQPLGRVDACSGNYRHGGGGGGDVDCSLRLELPGTGMADVGPLHRISSAPPAPGCSSHPQQTTIPATSELCTMCATTHTPLWRSGPLGPKSLCNACGIRYKKEERRLALTLGFSSSSHPPSKARQQQPKRDNC